MNFYIEVAVPEGTSTTERGRLLEKFGRKFLETQGYSVTEQVRLTGLEVDLLATGLGAGEKVFVECKAHRLPLSAEVLMKLMGQVHFKKYSAGWLLSSSPLSKDAKGMEVEWEKEQPDDRRRLQIYTPEKLIQRLVLARIIIDPAKLRLDGSKKYAEDTYLLVTPYGEFWATISLDSETNLRQFVHLFDAENGEPAAQGVVSRVKVVDTTLAELDWITGADAVTETSRQRLMNELQSIVPVQMADNWADYRPSRPEDFVGRDQLQQDVMSLFESARSGSSSTRLFAVKAPSGWGKSSFVLKIAHKASTANYGKKNFVYAVDSRAASSQRFAELALYSAIKKAMQVGFIDSVDELGVGGVGDPFSSTSIRKVLQQLKIEGKVICVIFDQFEELLYKDGLVLLFDEMKRFCDAIIEAQENVMIGFSWKTDGTIPPEHNAYHMWHNLSDHRREFELGLLSDAEVGTAINRFSRELGQAVAPQMRRLLHDHSQGFPWLLKKLCIHVLQQINGGLNQEYVLVRALKIEELFKKDLEGLSASQFACLKRVAKDAPAEFYEVSNSFDDVIINQLLDKRLIIRSGTKLSVYWDIFREYVLTDRIPYIPTTYIPQTNLNSYLNALRIIIRDRQTTYELLAAELGVTVGTADNVVRDMVMVGHAEASRQAGKVACLTEWDEASEAFVAFCKSHAIYRVLEEKRRERFVVEDVISLTRDVYKGRGVSDRVMLPYVRKLLSWFVAAGLVKKDGRFYQLTGSSTVKFSWDVRPARRGAGIFLGGSIPAKVTSAFELLCSGEDSAAVEAAYGYYAMSDLANLQLIDRDGMLETDATLFPNHRLLVALLAAETVRLTMDAESKEPKINGKAIGRMLAEHLKVAWTDSSCARIGNSLKRWTRWCRENTAT